MVNIMEVYIGMNKEQRRKTAKKGVTANDLKLIQDAAYNKAIEKAVANYAVASAVVLHDKFGYGEVRLKRYLQEAYDLFDAINEDYVNFDDMKKVLLEECKIKF